jgi:hypothetical protein
VTPAPPDISTVDSKHEYTVTDRSITARRAQRTLCQASRESIVHLEANTRGLKLIDNPGKLTREEGALRGLATRNNTFVTDKSLAINNSDRRVGTVNIYFHGPFKPDVQGAIGFWSFTPADGNMRTIEQVREKNFDTLIQGLN